MTSRTTLRLVALGAVAVLALALGPLRAPVAALLGGAAAPDAGPAALEGAPRDGPPPATWLQGGGMGEPLTAAAPPEPAQPGDPDPEPPAARDLLVKVLDAGGQPLGGAYVLATLSPAQSPAQSASGQTDDAGEAHLALVPGDWDVAVYGARPGDPLGRRFVEHRARVVLPDTTEITVALGEAEEVSGVVHDEGGRPVFRALVVAYRDEQPGGWDQTDERGRFAIEVPKGSRVTLRVEGRNESLDRLSRVPFAGEVIGVASGATDVVIAGRSPPQDRRLTVLVLDPEGLPAPGVCMALGRRFRSRIAWTDARGRAEFRDLSAEFWRVYVSRGPKGTPQWVDASGLTLVPDGQEVEFRVRPAAVVSGAVVDAEGQPAPGLIVEAVAAGATGAIESARTDDAGAFRMYVEPRTPLPVRLRIARDESDPIEDRAVLLELYDLPASGLTLRRP